MNTRRMNVLLAILVFILSLMNNVAIAQDPGIVIEDSAEALAQCSVVCAAANPQAPNPPTSSRINRHNIEQFLTDEHLTRWGVTLPKPSYIFTKNPGLSEDPSILAWTSVAYVDNSRYRLYVQPDGTVHAWVVPISVKPASTQSILTVVVDHGNTNIADVMATLLVDAQNAINADHWEHAAQIGLPEPIVAFDYSNLLVSANEFSDPLQGPKTPTSVYDLITTKGYAVDDFDLVVVMDLDPANQAGGWAYLGGTFAYIGWFQLGGAGYFTITPELMASFARALYHHEVGHNWGWEHTWDGNDFTYSGPLIVNPRLFGWTDIDGDGVPEILDSTPYGGAY